MSADRVDAWKAAYEQGMAGAFCDRIVATREPPDRLLRALDRAGAGRMGFGRPKQEEVRPFKLTRREREVLYLISVGWGRENIAAALCISPETVKRYVRRIMEHLGARNLWHAVSIGLREFEIV